MRKTRIGLTVASAMTAALAVALPAEAASTWSIAQTNALPGEDGITSVSVAPTGSTWAAGYQTVNGKVVPLVQHLLSGKWTTAKSPSATLGLITALSASSSKNVWAFGTPAGGTYAARWNGTSWTRSTMTTGNYQVQDASALSTANVWAVGGDQTRTALHWTGKSWHKTTLPGTARAIAGVSSIHVYAAGTYQNRPAVMHWTGSAWKLAATPKLKPPTSDAVGVFNDIYAPATNDVWAAGGFDWNCGEDGDDVCSQPILLHWNGKAWSVRTFSQGYAGFTRVTGDGGKGLWLLRGAWNPQLTHLVGSSATVVTPPHPAVHDINLTSLALQGKTVWAGGTAFPEGDPDDPTGNGVYLRTG